MDARIARSEQVPPVQPPALEPPASQPAVELTQAISPDIGKQIAWRVVGAVVRGVSHERLGMPCQDAQDYRVLPGGTLLVALADGAGSAAFSDQGARAAVNEALHALSDVFQNTIPADSDAWKRLMRDVFNSARAAVLQLADTNVREGVDPNPVYGEDSEPGESQGLQEAASDSTVAEEVSPPEDEMISPGREYATTLTCAVATADWLVVGQIGDGVVVAGDGEELLAVTQLQRGEYANETHFLTQADALDQMAIEIVERPVSELAVMSDGLIRLALKMPAQQPHAPFFQPLFRAISTTQDEAETARQLSVFLGSERVNARTDDDKSLVLAVRVEQQV
jgi:hypothetical protein